MDNELLVKSIRDLCKKNNVAVSQLESDLNFGAGLVSRWVKSSPSLDKIIDIADYFHVSLDEVVGYNQNIDDVFLNKLYEETNNGNLTWCSAKKMKKTNKELKTYDRREDYEPKYYDEFEYEQLTYVTKYNDGYFMLYAFYKYGEILNPIELDFIIQPSDNSYLNFQSYEKEKLLRLWVKVLNSLGDEIPDEVKAEDFKNSFLNDTKRIDNLSDETLLSITNNIIKEEPEMGKVFEFINNPMFQSMFESLQNPATKNALDLAQRLNKYYLMLKDKCINNRTKED